MRTPDPDRASTAADSDVYEPECFGPVAYLIATAAPTSRSRLFRSTVLEHGAMTASVYSTSDDVVEQMRDAALDAGVALSENLTRPGVREPVRGVLRLPRHRRQPRRERDVHRRGVRRLPLPHRPVPPPHLTRSVRNRTVARPLGPVSVCAPTRPWSAVLGPAVKDPGGHDGRQRARAIGERAGLPTGRQGYAEEVAAFNLSRQHTPDVVVAARSADDVVAAVRWAGEHALPVGVQATGHGAVLPITDGVLVSTRGLDEVTIDPERRTARVGAGVKWRRVLDEAAEYGLAGLCGSTSDVGVVGYTLGGGLPVLGRKYGFSSDRVRSFDVVTGDGRLHHVEAGDGTELDWALRGGKGNVGIVTSMEVELLEIADLYGGAIFWPGALAPTLLTVFAEWVDTLPDEFSASISLLRLPPLPGGTRAAARAVHGAPADRLPRRRRRGRAAARADACGRPADDRHGGPDAVRRARPDPHGSRAPGAVRGGRHPVARARPRTRSRRSSSRPGPTPSAPCCWWRCGCSAVPWRAAAPTRSAAATRRTRSSPSAP